MPLATTPAETRPKTQREELNAALHCRYIGYVERFHRRERLKGWLRFTVLHPFASLASMAIKRCLPGEWCRQPLSESEWLAEMFLAQLRNLPD